MMLLAKRVRALRPATRRISISSAEEARRTRSKISWQRERGRRSSSGIRMLTAQSRDRKGADPSPPLDGTSDHPRAWVRALTVEALCWNLHIGPADLHLSKTRGAGAV